MTKDSFTVLPAIDLRGGRAVRLTQGDPNRMTTYADDPLTWARRWRDEGASWLHVINLDGALGEDPSIHLETLESLVALGLKVEFGGGLRDRAGLRQVLEMGVERACLGTAAIQDPALVDWALAHFGPERIAADLGVRAGRVMIQGWQKSTPLTVRQAGEQFRRQGLKWCVLTEVGRDGTGKGIDLDEAVKLQAATGLQVIASGGVSRLEEVRAARKAGLAGIIIGRALYEGKISLYECWLDD